MKKVCVYCGSSPGFDPVYMDMAKSLGEALVKQNLELVFGGADVGLMGQVSNTVMQNGGAVYGVIPGLIAEKVPHGGLTEMYVEKSMHTRKERMFDLADAFVALPGGCGTLEELSEVLTWAQLGINKKPCGVINVNGYYDHLLKFFDHAVEKGFMRAAHKDLLIIAETPEEFLEKAHKYKPMTLDKWIK